MESPHTPADLPDALPALVRALRERAGLSHAGLAELVGAKSRTPPTWETADGWGRDIPTSALTTLLGAAGFGDSDPAWAHALRVHAAGRRTEESAATGAP